MLQEMRVRNFRINEENEFIRNKQLKGSCPQILLRKDDLFESKYFQLR